MAETSPKIKIIARALGRRKEASASVRLIPGSGQITVNGRPAADYFPGSRAQARYQLPFTTVTVTKYDATTRVSGGGPMGQLDAVVLGISRALSGLKAEHKAPLRNAGLLTRDPRKRQRRMVGMGGKSRRKKQSPKR